MRAAVVLLLPGRESVGEGEDMHNDVERIRCMLCIKYGTLLRRSRRLPSVQGKPEGFQENMRRPGVVVHQSGVTRYRHRRTASNLQVIQETKLETTKCDPSEMRNWRSYIPCESKPIHSLTDSSTRARKTMIYQHRSHHNNAPRLPAWFRR